MSSNKGYQSLIEALRRSQMKLRAYLGVCKDDKELPKVIEIVSDALNMLTCDCPAHIKERTPEPPNELLRDMRCHVEYTDVATMPIPLYERMKAAIAAIGDASTRKDEGLTGTAAYNLGQSFTTSPTNTGDMHTNSSLSIHSPEKCIQTVKNDTMGDASNRKTEEACGGSRRLETSPTKQHWSDCALHNGPAMTPGNCDCGVDPDMTPLKYGSEYPSEISVVDLPCPFCGGHDLRSGGDDKFVGVWCEQCGCQGPNHYGTGNDWNKRATREPVSVSLDKCAMALVNHHRKSCGEVPVTLAHMKSTKEFEIQLLEEMDSAKAVLDAAGLNYVD